MRAVAPRARQANRPPPPPPARGPAAPQQQGHAQAIPMRPLSPDSSAASSPSGTRWTAGPPAPGPTSGAANGAATAGGGATVIARVPVPAGRLVGAAASEAAAAVRARGGGSGGDVWAGAAAGGDLPMDTDFRVGGWVAWGVGVGPGR
jgi:hypothetical protein